MKHWFGSVALVLTMLVVGACQEQRLYEAPRGPSLFFFPGGRFWMLERPLVYRIGETQDSVVVPAGFVTDLASIPGRFQSFFSTNGSYQIAAIIHDYFYWVQSCTRAESDRIMLLAMQESQVRCSERRAIYNGVVAGGAAAWAANERDRTAGRPRIIPQQFRDIPPLTRWPDYQQMLISRGVRGGGELPVSRAFCAHGRP